MFIDEVCVFIYLITTLLFFMHILTVYTTLTFSIFCKAGLVWNRWRRTYLLWCLYSIKCL